MSVRQADWLTWGGLTPDFTLNKTQELYKQYHSKTFVDIGIAGFKLDEVYPSHIGTVQTTYAVLVNYSATEIQGIGTLAVNRTRSGSSLTTPLFPRE